MYNNTVPLELNIVICRQKVSPMQHSWRHDLWGLSVWDEESQEQLVISGNLKVPSIDIVVELLDNSNRSKRLLIDLGIVLFH